MAGELGMTGCGGGCGVDVTEEGLDPETTRKIAKHPCFNKEASHLFGRIHLEVAPECNVQCNFCLREFDCVNESRPGVTSQVLTPAEALERVKKVLGKFDNIRTIGIAGPGEPLYNEETFETFRLVRDNFDDLHLCISSNGLLLPDKVDLLYELGVDTVTVTLSAVDPKIGEKIYSWIYYDGQYYRDIQGAELLLSKQLEGIKMAVERGMLVKVNSVMIPTVNDHHLTEIAKKAHELGAFMQNIMPLIPQYKFAHLKPPTAGARKEAQDASSEYIKQMRHCRQCRADAVGLLGQDLNKELFEPKKIEVAKVDVPVTRVAVTSSPKDGWVDLHFGNTPRFLIYEVKGDTFRLLEARDVELKDGRPDLAKVTDLISDCKYVITRRAGPHAVKELEKAGIELIEDYSPVETAMNRLVKYFMK
ncbi:MAG: nitrogenase cofactor biosynthesis protein NifB [Chloroflexi bacterium]|nr:nitrogenase cofactor biosynthesis protein NifB [Chloroflexota bacterium]